MKHLVFVYGTLKKGFHNDCLINGQSYGKGTTAKKYFLIKFNGLPFLIDNKKHRFSTFIKGEVYLINDDNLLELDHLERHPVFYRRKKIKICVKGILIDCWCYFLNDRSYIDEYEIITDGNYMG